MGQGSNAVDTGAATDERSADSADTDEMVGDIENTRSNMSGTIAAIGEKLNPQVVASEAKDAASEIIQHLKETLPEVASNAAHNFVSGVIEETKGAFSSVVDTSRDALGGAVNNAKGASMTLVDRISHNPIPAAVVGIGLYWLLKGGEQVSAGISGGSSGQSGNYSNGDPSTVGASAGKMAVMTGHVQDAAGNLAHQVQDKTSHVADQIQSAVGGAVDQVSTSAHQGGDWFQRTLQESPIVVGAMAVAFGLAVGMAIPETNPEHRLMGAAKDKIAQKAQDKAQELGEKVQAVAQDAMAAVSESAQKQGVTA